jgi:hypothetical protein
VDENAGDPIWGFEGPTTRSDDDAFYIMGVRMSMAGDGIAGTSIPALADARRVSPDSAESPALCGADAACSWSEVHVVSSEPPSDRDFARDSQEGTDWFGHQMTDYSVARGTFSGSLPGFITKMTAGRNDAGGLEPMTASPAPGSAFVADSFIFEPRENVLGGTVVEHPSCAGSVADEWDACLGQYFYTVNEVLVVPSTLRGFPSVALEQIAARKGQETTFIGHFVRDDDAVPTDAFQGLFYVREEEFEPEEPEEPAEPCEDECEPEAAAEAPVSVFEGPITRLEGPAAGDPWDEANWALMYIMGCPVRVHPDLVLGGPDQRGRARPRRESARPARRRRRARTRAQRLRIDGQGRRRAPGRRRPRYEPSSDDVRVSRGDRRARGERHHLPRRLRRRDRPWRTASRSCGCFRTETAGTSSRRGCPRTPTSPADGSTRAAIPWTASQPRSRPRRTSPSASAGTFRPPTTSDGAGETAGTFYVVEGETTAPPATLPAVLVTRYNLRYDSGDGEARLEIRGQYVSDVDLDVASPVQISLEMKHAEGGEGGDGAFPCADTDDGSDCLVASASGADRTGFPGTILDDDGDAVVDETVDCEADPDFPRQCSFRIRVREDVAVDGLEDWLSYHAPLALQYLEKVFTIRVKADDDGRETEAEATPGRIRFD